MSESVDSSVASRRLPHALRAQLLQDFPQVNSAEDSGFFAHQPQQYRLSFRTDRSQAPEIDDEFALFKICFGIFVRTRELSGPRCNESALDDESALALALDNRDLQHAALVPGGMRTHGTHQRGLELIAVFSI